MEHLQSDRSTTAVVEDAYHAAHTAKQDGFLVVGVYDCHESRQQELMSLVDVFLSDYYDLINFWKFASVD
jgi:beta-phosphoglucomutase-like phosphatase (HAD superfamily)